MLNAVFNLNFTNSMLAIIIYWVPLCFCTIGYFVRTWRNYRDDFNRRETQKYYSPNETVGSLIGRALITIMPIGNILAAVFDVAPDLFRNFFKVLREIFNQPLVPEKKTIPNHGESL